MGICSSRKSEHWPLPRVVLLSLRNSHCNTLEGFSCAWKSEHPCPGVLQPCSDEDARSREAGAPAQCARAPKRQVPVAGRQTGSRERGSGHTLPGSWRGASRDLRPRKATAGPDPASPTLAGVGVDAPTRRFLGSGQRVAARTCGGRQVAGRAGAGSSEALSGGGGGERRRR